MDVRLGSVTCRIAGMNGNGDRTSRANPPGDDPGSVESGILNERVLMLVFESINWDLHVLCSTASVCQKLRAVARRLMWRELCLSRVPRMATTLVNGAPNGRVGGGWEALAKLLYFCSGCEPSRHFRVSRPSPGHVVKASRFSKTSGRSFLTRKCRGDLLYVSDPCEHPMGDNEDYLGVFRGVFKGFMRSRTRACLIGRRVEFEQRVRCPYCGARVWSMTTARLVPRCASRRLGSHEGSLEYFVCVNGHLHGTCWLAPLSSDEDHDYDEDQDEDDGDGDGRVYINGGDNKMGRVVGQNIGRLPSSSGEVVGDGPAD